MPFLLKLSPTNFSIQTWTVQILLLFCFGPMVIWSSTFINWNSSLSKSCLFKFIHSIIFISMNSWLFILSYGLKPDSIVIYFVA